MVIENVYEFVKMISDGTTGKITASQMGNISSN